MDKEKRREYNKKYWKKNRENLNKLKKEYHQEPEVIKRLKEYHQEPEVIKRLKEYELSLEVKIRRKEYRKNNKEKIKVRNKVWKEKNSNYNKVYRKKNREDLNKKSKKYIKERRKIDLNFRIKGYLRTMVWIALKHYTKTGKIMSSRKYGINHKKIIEYLKPFPKNISNYHIDHIRPLCSFDLTNLEEIKIAFAPENHQWLTAQENMKKGGRIVMPCVFK